MKREVRTKEGDWFHFSHEEDDIRKEEG